MADPTETETIGFGDVELASSESVCFASDPFWTLSSVAGGLKKPEVAKACSFLPNKMRIYQFCLVTRETSFASFS